MYEETVDRDQYEYVYEYPEEEHEPGYIPYAHYKKWKWGWRKYPLFVIILGG